VSAKLIPQFSDAVAMIDYARQRDIGLMTVLVPNLKGAERAIAAHAESLVLPISASETHSQKNIRKSREEQISELRRIRDLIDDQPEGSRPLLAAGIATAFGCSYEGSISEDDVFLIVDKCLDVGVDEIGLADTVGYATPRQISSAFDRLNQRVDSSVGVRAHLHDTFGMGLANAFAALECGVKFIDASLCGLGGCPFAPGSAGNITLEDLVYMVQKLGLKTGIDLDKLLSGKALLRELVPETTLRGALSITGRYPADFVPERLNK
jgi:hydroxymethylglutaryl-CoA lyase